MHKIKKINVNCYFDCKLEKFVIFSHKLLQYMYICVKGWSLHKFVLRRDQTMVFNRKFCCLKQEVITLTLDLLKVNEVRPYL